MRPARKREGRRFESGILHSFKKVRSNAGLSIFGSLVHPALQALHFLLAEIHVAVVDLKAYKAGYQSMIDTKFMFINKPG